MKRFLFCITLGMVSLLQGCGGDPGKYPDPVDVSGKVVGANGAPVTGVKILFQPTSTIPTAFGQVGKAGEFKTKAVPAEYIFYFEPRSVSTEEEREEAAAAFASIAAKYREPQKENTVKLGSTPVEIKLAP